MICLLFGLLWQIGLLCHLNPFQKALVHQIPPSLAVGLRGDLSVDHPFLLHDDLLGRNLLPNEYRRNLVLVFAGVKAVATSSKSVSRPG
jgi:hypothetical protein